MGTSTSALQLSRKFDALAREIEQNQREAIRTAAAETQRVVLGKIAAATGGDLLLSGMNKGGKPAKLGVRSKIETRGTGVQAFIAATGPAQLVENDVAKHYVVSKYAKGAQRISQTTGRKLRSTRQSRIASVAFGQGAAGGGRRAVLHWGGSNYARYTVAHSKGRHPWEHGINEAAPKVPQIIAAGNRKALVSAFR